MNILRTLTLLLLALVLPAHAQTWHTFEIRAAAPMVGRSLEITDPSGSSTTVGNFSLWQPWPDGATNSYSVIYGVQFLVDESQPEQVWTFAAGGRVAQVTGATLSGAVQFSQLGNGSYLLPVEFVNGSVEFLAAPSNDGMFHLTDPMAMVQGGSITAMTHQGEVVEGGTLQYGSFQWLRCSASGNPAAPFYVVNLATGQRTQDNATILGLAEWTADPVTVYPLVPVTFHFDMANWGQGFTLHYQAPGRPGMVAAFNAGPLGVTGAQVMSDGQSVNVTGSVGFTGSVAVGSRYWITRSADGWDSQARDGTNSLGNGLPGPWTEPLSYAPIQWAFMGTLPPPVENMQPVEFYMPSGMSGYIHQPAADRALGDVVRTEMWMDYDSNANPHPFWYDVRVAEVNINQPFWLEINGTEVSMNQQWYFAGWSPLNGPSEPPPPPPTVIDLSGTLILPEARQSHSLELMGPYGSAGWLSWASGTSQSITLNDPWHSELPFSLQVIAIPFDMSYSENTSPGGTPMLIDWTTGESQPLSSGTMDFSQWWLPAEALPLQISLSRWDHDLRIRQPNGDEYSILPGSSQGDLTVINGGAWYQSYFYFDGNGNRRPGIDSWVYDATTGEESPWNQADLTGWVYCPSITESNAAQLGRTYSVEVKWRLPAQSQDALLGGGFSIERWRSDTESWSNIAVLAALDCRMPSTADWFHHIDSAPPRNGVSVRYRITYGYGATYGTPSETSAIPIPLDSDGDGIADWWELAHGLNPFGLDAGGDGDLDNLTNLAEFLADTNPAAADTDDDGTADDVELAANTDPIKAAPKLTLTLPSGATFVP